jgi:hypothetical protein
MVLLVFARRRGAFSLTCAGFQQKPATFYYKITPKVAREFPVCRRASLNPIVGVPDLHFKEEWAYGGARGGANPETG